MSKNTINSHYIQKALLKEIFKEREFYVFKNCRWDKCSFERAGSLMGLFDLKRDDAIELESLINETLEDKVFNLLKGVKDEKVKFSANDVMNIRKYFLITYYRLVIKQLKDENKFTQLQKQLINLIQKYSNNEYTDRFDNHEDEAAKFFLQNSNIKFVEHVENTFLLTDNFYHTMPFDTQNSDSKEIRQQYGEFISFCIPISRNHSILFSSNLIFEDSIKLLINKKMLMWRLNVVDPIPFIVNTTKKEVNGVITNCVQPKTKEAYSFFENDIHKENELFYIYEIYKVKDHDRWILILDNLHKLHHHVSLKNKKENFIITKKFVEKIMGLFEIEEYVNNNNPEDILYWSENMDRKIQHKIWELIRDDFKEALKNIIKDFNAVEASTNKK